MSTNSKNIFTYTAEPTVKDAPALAAGSLLSMAPPDGDPPITTCPCPAVAVVGAVDIVVSGDGAAVG